MRKYLRFVSQSVLGMLGLSVYILADTFFIANYIGADGLASLNLALPIYGIINGTGLLIKKGQQPQKVTGDLAQILIDEIHKML